MLDVDTYTDRDVAILWARKMLATDFVVLDTETTGLRDDDEAVSLAVVSKVGEVLLDTLLCHTKDSSPEALRVHGHSRAETRAAPPFSEIWPRLLKLIQGQALVIYNADFDLRIINQMLRRYEIDTAPDLRSITNCAMDAFSMFYGEWNDYYGSYRWQKLTVAAAHFGIDTSGAHGAAADALMTLRVVEAMAKAELSGELDITQGETNQ